MSLLIKVSYLGLIWIFVFGNVKFFRSVWWLTDYKVERNSSAGWHCGRSCFFWAFLVRRKTMRALTSIFVVVFGHWGSYECLIVCWNKTKNKTKTKNKKSSSQNIENKKNHHQNHAASHELANSNVLFKNLSFSQKPKPKRTDTTCNASSRRFSFSIE